MAACQDREDAVQERARRGPATQRGYHKAHHTTQHGAAKTVARVMRSNKHAGECCHGTEEQQGCTEPPVELPYHNTHCKGECGVIARKRGVGRVRDEQRRVMREVGAITRECGAYDLSDPECDDTRNSGQRCSSLVSISPREPEPNEHKCEDDR